MPGEKKSTPKATVIKDSCTPPAAMGECLMCTHLTSISFHLINSCSRQKRSRCPRNSWSHRADVPGQVQSGVTPQCQRSSSSAIPTGSEQREAEQSRASSALLSNSLLSAPDKPRGSPGTSVVLWTNPGVASWLKFFQELLTAFEHLSPFHNNGKANLSFHRLFIIMMRFHKALLHSHGALGIW